MSLGSVGLRVSWFLLAYWVVRWLWELRESRSLFLNPKPRHYIRRLQRAVPLACLRWKGVGVVRDSKTP